MAVYKKEDGVWVAQAGRPHVKVDGAWTPVLEGYVKRSGVWTPFYQYDNTPPVAPTLNAVEYQLPYVVGGETRISRWIQVTTNVGATNDTTCRRVRLLVSNTSQPTSQYDTTGFITGPDNTYSQGTEPWSELYYNGYNGVSRQTQNTSYRLWTRNPAPGTVIPAGTYYFSAWAEDFAGNWSSGTYKSVVISSNFDPTSTKSYSATLSAQNAGSLTSDGYTRGDQTQASSPRSRGFYFYNNQFNQVGSHGTSPTITSAQIFLHRRNDSGKPNANVYLFWHPYATRDDMPGSGIATNGVTKIGTISKGESKWFDIPQGLWDNIQSGAVKGFGLNDKASGGTAGENDYSVMKSLSDAPRSGEVKLTWTEKL